MISQNCLGRYSANYSKFLSSHSIQFKFNSIQFYTHLFKDLKDLSATFLAWMDQYLIYFYSKGSIEWHLEIDDYAKDGGEELFTKMHCVRIRNR